MSLSVVSVAMHLSGLDAQHFTSGDQKLRLLYEDGARKLQSPSPAFSVGSTTSTTSSSGFNSWGSESQKDDAPAVGSPNTDKEKNSSNIMYNGRNILDLGSNLRDSKWSQFRYTELPKDPINFFKNRSQYSRVNEDPVPMHTNIICSEPDCGFTHPVYEPPRI